jgi:2-polyprenyl-6-methoxyphenol hydroxylase-like FAD-dependent oxidoreductase
MLERLLESAQMQSTMLLQQMASSHSHCRFESYEEDSDGVNLSFVGGEPGPVRAKVLIGADGYFSAVRQQCLQDGPPNFAVSRPNHLSRSTCLSCRSTITTHLNVSKFSWNQLCCFKQFSPTFLCS